VLRRTGLAAAALLLLPLGACADEDAPDSGSSTSSSASDEPAATGSFEEVSFAGDVGEGITATWSAPVEVPTEISATTLIAGDGEPLVEGDTVNAYLWVGNGTAQEQVYSDYDNGAPVAIPFDPAQLDEVFLALFEGHTYGSRIAVVTDPETLYPDGVEGNPLGAEPGDALVIVADLVEKQAVAPQPTDDGASDAEPDTQPSVVEQGGNPTGLDFSGLEEPELDTPVQRVVLTEGDGAPIKATDTLTVNYLGSVYDADAPFDESFSRGEPLVSPLSGLIRGWSIGLEGVPVGSRVLLQIPPAFGYGAEGSPPSIPGNATLWFLIDVIKAE
jgi:peptidylprolyl isomerase